MAELTLTDPLPSHQRVAVLGLGASGRAACRLLGRLGKSVIASDRRTDRPEGLGDHVEFRGGGNSVGDATAVVVSPGLNPEWPENRSNPQLAPIWEAVHAKRLEIWSEVELAIAALARPTITIGGTDGKSTTAAMIRDLLGAADKRVAFGGNSWTALSVVVCDADVADYCVAEVSAFQLWAGHRLHPNVSVLTNIAPDHLDHYAHEEDYVRAKLHIYEHMTAGDVAVLNAEDARLGAASHGLQARGISVERFGIEASTDGRAHVDGDVLRWGEATLPRSCLAVPGTHNQKNALSAFLAARALCPDVTLAVAESAFAAFQGLPHRLERVRVRHGVTWFNDSKATNVHAAVTGLRSLELPVVAIVGGVDKQLDLGDLIEELRNAVAVIVIGELRARLVAEVGGGFEIRTAENLEEAVRIADGVATTGDAVVLAPGCSSFDMFDSFEHRGDVFRDLVLAL